jgi:transcription elongation factor Elf1
LVSTASVLAVKQWMAGGIKTCRTCCKSYSFNISQQTADIKIFLRFFRHTVAVTEVQIAAYMGTGNWLER